MTAAIEGVFLRRLLLPFVIVCAFVLAVIILTMVLVKKELSNEETD
jgi:hypothetical protein